MTWGTWSCPLFWKSALLILLWCSSLWSASLLFLRISDLCECASFFYFSFFLSVWLLYNAVLVSAGQEKLLYVYMYPLPLGSPSPKSFLVIKNKDLMHYYILCWKRKNAFCWGWVCRAPDTGRSPETSLKRRIFKGRQKYKEEPSISFCDKNYWKISLFPFGQPFPNYSCCKNLWVAPPHTSVYP